jgi:hypothetical protein
MKEGKEKRETMQSTGPPAAVDDVIEEKTE